MVVVREHIELAKPIKKNLLIHSVTYYKWLDNKNRGENYDTPITLDYVRLEPSSKVVGVAGGNEWIAKTLMFYDMVYSTTTEIKEKSKIEFVDSMGVTRTYYIRQVDELYNGDKIHHLEIYMS